MIAIEVDVMIKVKNLFVTTITRLESKGVASQLSTRLTQRFKEITVPQNVNFPPEEDLNYDNMLVAVMDAKTHCEYNFVLKDGSETALTPYNKLHRVEVADRPVKRIRCWFDTNNVLWGFQLLDDKGDCLYKSALNCDKYTKVETVLEDGERVLGVKGRKYNDKQATYYDFQFIIGKLQG